MTFLNPEIPLPLTVPSQETKLGWFTDPDNKSVMVFQPNQLPEVKYDADILPVLSVIESWQISATDVLGLLKFQ